MGWPVFLVGRVRQVTGCRDMLGWPHQFHFTSFSRAGEYAKTTTDAFFGIDIGSFSTMLRIVFHLGCIDRASLHAYLAAAAFLRVNGSYETTLGQCQLIQLRFCLYAALEYATATIMAIANQGWHGIRVACQVHERILVEFIKEF
jgi:hypothetical protein